MKIPIESNIMMMDDDTAKYIYFNYKNNTN